MENLSLKVQAYLGKEFTDTEVRLQDDGSGSYIAFWSDSLAKAKPTDDELNALSSEATKIKDDKLTILNRTKEYGSEATQLEYIVENGVSAFIDRQNAIKIKYPKG
tara:strand:- start:139 stop:456 length:318 start_codon:yes stop_codon:yes gene_type:complete